MQKKIGTIIIGGTYNPVHIGHMHLADEVGKMLKPDRILIIPSYISAHKQNDTVISPEHRLEMLRIACRNTGIIIETCELERRGVSYSIDTIRFIRQKYNLTKNPGLLIGDDLAKGFAAWRNADQVAQEAQLIIAYREQADDIDFGYSHRRIDNLMLNISSSDIRRRLREGRACRYLMPAGVYEYIKANGLYGDDNVQRQGNRNIS